MLRWRAAALLPAGVQEGCDLATAFAGGVAGTERLSGAITGGIEWVRTGVYVPAAAFSAACFAGFLTCFSVRLSFTFIGLALSHEPRLPATIRVRSGGRERSSRSSALAALAVMLRRQASRPGRLQGTRPPFGTKAS
ncbi:MAG: hypothetical protein L0Y57_10365 [Beijerinckiaceae bacterium]|nr:hypothetical protein [Beijerinckiaceae bacterium]MCI0599999.1 hypothetical protein [Beijerinckiaceae bacterium]MCI0735237.1 hypothetical protein [Beijerinckiaceae bacterium]